MDATYIQQEAMKAKAADPDQLASLAPRPQTLAETGLTLHFTHELIAKHLYNAGVLTLHELSERLALSASVLEEVIGFLRQDAYIEIRSAIEGKSGLRYALTDRGRALALDSLLKSGYIGPAPVPLREYTRIVRAQSVHNRSISRSRMQVKLAGVTVQHGLLDKLGPAIHSGRAIFIYGQPGTGKTYICQKLANLFDDDILIPHAILVSETVIQVFDPVYHYPLNVGKRAEKIALIRGHDPRFIRCHRPAVMTGGELTLDMLELSYDADTRQYQAPLQLKANNGVFMIDDLGRQRVAPADLLNRWIIPMENRRDYMYLGSGLHFPVPFEVILIFSTNMNPLELADEAFLRRIGHKIRFDTLNQQEFEAIWRQVCDERGIEFNREVLNYLFREHYQEEMAPMLPCHPRDLIGLALDMVRYRDDKTELTPDTIRSAWDSYFVRVWK
jgi:predicted ATPase with chaperone activity